VSESGSDLKASTFFGFSMLCSNKTGDSPAVRLANIHDVLAGIDTVEEYSHWDPGDSAESQDGIARVDLARQIVADLQQLVRCADICDLVRRAATIKSKCEQKMRAENITSTSEKFGKKLKKLIELVIRDQSKIIVDRQIAAVMRQQEKEHVQEQDRAGGDVSETPTAGGDGAPRDF
jgi:hypothetical protein